ncbi:MAG: SDR family NAD(P)-dependent oxidoreductase [Hahellaceae bacterium]|nr:SDR family NAD(P)-dependent oxidoreductase [Hahellaceae bacterium]MCP5168352.1 SDR family NAD(P)-dependent oxidoreductase [Hahellaceae bacterium]
MSKMKNKVVLITGAGSGIGRETAIVFAQQGAHIVMVDRDQAGMEGTGRLVAEAGSDSEAHLCDVSSREAMRALADEVHRRHQALDVLINNAGIGSAGRFLETNLDTWEKVLDVNVLGVVHGCHFFAPRMVATRNGGSIVNIASAAAFAAAKEMPIYAASKFAVFGFTESLRADLSEYGIHVATICPGLINTPIVKNTLFEGAMAAGGKARDKAMALYQRRNYPPEKVAQAIFKAVVKRKSVVPVSPEAWALYYAKRFVPSIMEQLGKMDAPVAK